jgi:hypothetical protein
MVGRPGLDPGTLGPERQGPHSSIDIHLSWSSETAGPPPSREVLFDLVLRLSNWLSIETAGVVGVLRAQDAEGAMVHIRVVPGQENG